MSKITVESTIDRRYLRSRTKDQLIELVMLYAKINEEIVKERDALKAYPQKKSTWHRKEMIERYVEPETLGIMNAMHMRNFPPVSWIDVDYFVCKAKGIEVVK